MSPKFTKDPKIQEKTRELIANGNTSDALLLLFENGYDQAIGLKTRLEEALGHFETKRIDFSTFSALQNQVNYSIMAMLNPEIMVDSPNPATENRLRNKAFQPGPVAKAAIVSLLDENKVLEALNLCDSLGNDQALLKARYLAGKKYVLLGLANPETWDMLERQIKFSLQEMIKSAPDSGLSHPNEQPLVTAKVGKPQKAPKNILEQLWAFLRN